MAWTWRYEDPSGATVVPLDSAPTAEAVPEPGRRRELDRRDLARAARRRRRPGDAARGRPGRLRAHGPERALVHGQDDPHARPSRPGGWTPPPWLLGALAAISIASGAFRLALGSSLFDRGFGVLLLVLGASWLRDLRRTRAARDVPPTGGGTD